MEQERVPNIVIESYDNPRRPSQRNIELDVNGMPVGDVKVVIPDGPEPWLEGNYPNSPILTLLAVQDRYRRKGYATLLIAEAEKYAKSIGATEIVLGVEHDRAARRMYEKLGYQYVLEQDNPDSTREWKFGEEVELIPMVKVFSDETELDQDGHHPNESADD